MKRIGIMIKTECVYMTKTGYVYMIFDIDAVG